MHYYRRDLLQPRSTVLADEARRGAPAVATATSESERDVDASTIAVAATLVPAAAAILDREIAAGVLAARESRRDHAGSGEPPTSTPPTSGAPALLPLLDALIEATADVIQANAESARSSRSFPDPSGKTALSGFYGPGRVLRAGDVAAIPLDNLGSASGIGAIVPSVGELLSADGVRLPAEVIRAVGSTPASDSPMPGTLQVRVPNDARPGHYEALLLVPGMPGFRGVVGLDIV